MKHLFYVLLLLTILSCGSDKIVQLPEIEKAKITKIHDVSPIYMFFDKETDSIEFNRKNMIGTTNWLVNIDKRLTLKQILPHLQYLQEKRHGDGMHKNENAKNYFTCHDLSKQNLGFIEFTDVHYYLDEKPNSETEIIIEALDKITIKKNNDVDIFFKTNFKTLEKDLASIYPLETISVTLCFKKSMTFQQYITIKSKLQELDDSKILIENNEFIY